MADEKSKLNKDGLEAGAMVSEKDHAKVLLKHRKEKPVVDEKAEALAQLTKLLAK